MSETNHEVCFTTFGSIIKQAQTMHTCPAFNVAIRTQHTSYTIEPTSEGF